MSSGKSNRIALPVVASLAALAGFWLAGNVFVWGYALDLGSLNFPTPGYVICAAFWEIFGGAAAALFTIAFARWAGSPIRFERLISEWRAMPERRFLAWMIAAAIVIPLTLRFAVLRGAPLADDESAYRFTAELLASGRLWVPSPPMKLFFDQNFIINDGRLYTVYFLGWPALLVPGVLLGAPAVINPLMSALGLPALYLILRRLTSPAWARLGLLLFLAAPFLQLDAATLLSHTSCLTALTWALYFCLRTRDGDAGPLHHAGFAVLFATAFWIRPESAVALGLPLLVYWGAGVWRMQGAARVRAAAAFAVPAAILAALFVLTLWAQNGSPFRIGYARSAQYLVENDFRFTSFNPHDLTRVAGFDFADVSGAVARTASGLFRLNFDLFGWPSSFVMLLCAWRPGRPEIRLVWWTAGSFLVAMFFQSDWGIDTFGPMHAFELALPILILTIVGARRLSHAFAWRAPTAGETPGWDLRALGPAALGGLVLAGWTGFIPIRLSAVQDIASHLNLALHAPELSGLHNAVVFSPLPFAPSCQGEPRHFVLFRPVNDPDLRNDVLWVNHLDLASDRRLMDTLPGRTGYLMRWTTSCTVTLAPLSELRPGEVPTGRIRLN